LADDGWEQLQALAYFDGQQALALPAALWVAAQAGTQESQRLI